MKTLAASLVAAGVAVSAAASSFPFTSFRVPGASLTMASGINNHGQIVGLFRDATGDHQFLKDGDTFTTFDVPGVTPSGYATGINNNGQIVGSAYVPFEWIGFLKDGATITALRDPDATGMQTLAISINDAGQIVGHYVTNTLPGPFHGFLKTGSTYATIEVPGASETFAFGINNAGQIVGSFRNATGQHAYLKNASGFVTFDVPGAQETIATAINNHGQIAGYYHDTTGDHGFLRVGSAITTLDVPGASQTIPLGINDALQVSGWYGGVPSDIYPYGFVTPTLTIDTTPPVITLSVTPNVLWPPNHKLVEIAVNGTAADDHDPNPTIGLLSITCNQPVNTTGDGNTSGDIVVQAGRIFLRAERSGNSDRIYTITYAASDAAGNSATATATVTVPGHM